MRIGNWVLIGIAAMVSFLAIAMCELRGITWDISVNCVDGYDGRCGLFGEDLASGSRGLCVYLPENVELNDRELENLLDSHGRACDLIDGREVASTCLPQWVWDRSKSNEYGYVDSEEILSLGDFNMFRMIIFRGVTRNKRDPTPALF